ncbi:hypothetical protein J4727_15245 [Providencia rettgeri]|uniref:Uncharacterized protein n=1 Tax=Providencia rettgeri TaxID=587 RepID=A0A939NCA3_PRORE|nr:hypothetical protein [Providencia rettgeri]
MTVNFKASGMVKLDGVSSRELELPKANVPRLIYLSEQTTASVKVKCQ